MSLCLFFAPVCSTYQWTYLRTHIQVQSTNNSMNDKYSLAVIRYIVTWIGLLRLSVKSIVIISHSHHGVVIDIVYAKRSRKSLKKS